MSHICHARECITEVPPKMFMCSKHWYQLPKVMRDNIWKLYRVGQEIDKSPSGEYLCFANECIAWLYEHEQRREANDRRLF